MPSCFERDNVNLDNLVLPVLGKGHKERLVPISPELQIRCVRWLPTEAPVSVPDSRGGARDLCRIVGITTHVHPHCFRPHLRGSCHQERPRHVSAVAHPRTLQHQHDADLLALNGFRPSSGGGEVFRWEEPERSCWRQ